MHSADTTPWTDPGLAPTGFPRLEGTSVHVWKLDVPNLLPWLPSAERLLNDEERSRTERFHFLADQHRFAFTRAALRLLMGNYLDADPRSLRFGFSDHGKPYLLDSGGTAPCHLEFNVSHSGDHAMIGVGCESGLGVDIERIRLDLERDILAKRFFSPREAAELSTLSTAEATGAFFRCWTRKEAYVKACGEGLSLGLDSFAVTFAPHAPAQLVWSKRGPEELAAWRLWDLPVAEDYCACLATSSRVTTLSLFSFRPHGSLS